MGTQSAIAETMVRRDGDYLLALRANWPVLHAEIARFFANPPSNKIERDEAIAENDHGRLEQRRHPICHEIDWLWSDRRYTGEPRFPHLAMVAMVDSRAERAGKWKPNSASAKLDPKTFAAAVPAHCGIENRLHWVLRRRLPRRSCSSQNRLWTAKHSCRQTHRNEPRKSMRRSDIFGKWSRMKITSADSCMAADGSSSRTPGKPGVWSPRIFLFVGSGRPRLWARSPE
jgi:predicted transposase YbfD/YdcC